jgi:hypothetical protein
VRLEAFAPILPRHLTDRSWRDGAQQARSREKEGVFGGFEDRLPRDLDDLVEDAHRTEAILSAFGDAATTVLRIVAGDLDGTQGFMVGKIKIKGDMMFAMQVPQMFGL